MPHQRPVLSDPARFKVVVCGRRWGKTALGLLATVLGHGHGTRKGAIDGGQIWWVAPDYPTADAIWRDLNRLCKPILTGRDAVGRRVDLPGGGSVTVKSAHDPESLVGVGLDGVVIDEAAKVHEDAWYRSVRPTLSDKGGWAIFIGTPNGYNWLHKVFEHAGTESDWARWQLPTSQNPLVHQSELDAAKRDSPAFFGQEYLAQFTSIEGAEFPAEWFDGILFDDWPADVMHMTRVMALDPSKGKADRTGDYSAWIMLAVDASVSPPVLWIDADMSNTRPVEPSPSAPDMPSIVGDGYQLMTAFGPQAVLIETNGFQELVATAFWRYCVSKAALGIPVHTICHTEPKASRIRSLGPYFAQRRARIRNSKGGLLLVQQFRDYRADAKPSEGIHDDGPDGVKTAETMAEWLLFGDGMAGKQPQALRV